VGIDRREPALTPDATPARHRLDLKRRLAGSFRQRAIGRGRARIAAFRLAATGVLSLGIVGIGGFLNENVEAVGDTRSLSLFYTHTKDTLNITYKRNGYYDRDALKQLNYFLRDWRRNEEIEMDPRLFDVLWEVYREAGHEGDTITVVSAYRSPETNAMLRRRSRAVAKHSQHTLGKAMDTTMPGMNMEKIREIGMRLQRGGVGYYPTAGTPFVHLDVGGVRAWPRMSTAQLVALFPDQKTVHLPSDGPPLAGYQEALAEIQRGGGSAGGAGDEEEGSSFNLFAALFGGGRSSAPARTTQVASRSAPQQQVAYATHSDSDTGVREFLATDGLAPQPDPRRGRAARVRTPAPIQVASAATAPAAEPAPAQQSVLLSSPGATAALGSRAVQPTVGKPQDLLAAIEKDVPMPPRRPGDLLLATLPVDGAPMPPTRPPELMADASTKGGFQLASAEPQRKQVPLPPIFGRSDVPQEALGYASTAASVVPLPPLRGLQAEQARQPAVPLVPVGRNAARSEASIASAPHPVATRQPLQVAALSQSSIVATRFGSTPRLEAGRFSQGMTAPLNAAFVSNPTR